VTFENWWSDVAVLTEMGRLFHIFPTVPDFLGTVPGRALVDSGAVRSIMSGEMYRRIQTTSAESIENRSYLVWNNTQFEKDGELRSQPTCGK